MDYFTAIFHNLKLKADLASFCQGSGSDSDAVVGAHVIESDIGLRNRDCLSVGEVEGVEVRNLAGEEEDIIVIETLFFQQVVDLILFSFIDNKLFGESQISDILGVDLNVIKKILVGIHLVFTNNSGRARGTVLIDKISASSKEAIIFWAICHGEENIGHLNDISDGSLTV